MGSGCSSSGRQTVTYSIESPCFADHYTTGETLGKGAFGVVKVCALKPKALAALKDYDPQSDPYPVSDDQVSADRTSEIRRRQKFRTAPMAVKIMRHSMNSSEGDSVDKIKVQMQELQEQIDAMEQNLNAKDFDNEELQWHHDYMDRLEKMITEKRSNRIKKTPRENMLREVSLVQKCGQGNFIMQHVETFEEPGNFCVVFERCYGSAASRYPEGVRDCAKVCKSGYQLLSAIVYLHSIFILHRDIKPENLMYRTEDDSEVVLGDFGMAVELRKADDRCQGCAGTPHFVSPESFHSYYQSFPSDYWSVGCTLYCMLLGQCPFEVFPNTEGRKKSNRSIQTTGLYAMLRSTRMGAVLQGWKPQFEQEQTAALARKIVHPRHMPDWIDLSQKPIAKTPQHALAKNLIESLLHKDPKQRCTGVEALKHKWFCDKVDNTVDDGVDSPRPVALLVNNTRNRSKSSNGSAKTAQVHPVTEGINLDAQNRPARNLD